MKNAFFLPALFACILTSPSPTSAQAPTDKQFQAIEKLMAPQRKKVTDILEADKTGQYKTYKADLQTIAKEKDLSRREEFFAKLERDHYEFIKKNYEKVVINHEEQRLEIARILGHNNFTLGEFADIQIEFVPPSLALPERFDVTLNCPFESLDESDNSAVAADCIAQAFNCHASAFSLSEVAGGCRSKADVGGQFVLPEGTFTNIKVAAQSNISYDGWVVAIAGYGQINAKFGIRFRAPGLDKVVMAKEVHAVAPLVWFRRLQGSTQNFMAQASFTGTFNGGSTITAQVHAETFALSVPYLTINLINADSDDIDFIRIDGSN